MDRFLRVHFYVSAWVLLLLPAAAAAHNISTEALFFCDFSVARPRFVARLARSDSPQSRGPCPRADPCEIADDKGSGLFLSLSYC